MATRFDSARPRPDEYVEGFQLGLRVAAAIAAVGILVAALGIGRVRHEAHEAAVETA